MVVSELTNRILESIADANSTEQSTMMYIHNEILNVIGCKDDRREKYYKTYNELMASGDGNSQKLAGILFNLSLEDGKYLKYYVLDLLTAGEYVRNLIKGVVSYWDLGINFRFHFSLRSLTGFVAQPTLHIEINVGAQYRLSNIILEEAINGMTSDNDVLTLLSDCFMLLDGYYGVDFLTNRFYSQELNIKYSKSRSLPISYRLTPHIPSIYSQLKRTVATVADGVGYGVSIGDIDIINGNIMNNSKGLLLNLGYLADKFGLPRTVLMNI